MHLAPCAVRRDPGDLSVRQRRKHHGCPRRTARLDDLRHVDQFMRVSVYRCPPFQEVALSADFFLVSIQFRDRLIFIKLAVPAAYSRANILPHL
jgi:hypothetical protein